MHPLPLLAGLVLAVHVFRGRRNHGRPYLAAGALATALLLAFGVGAVELPDTEKLIADIGQGLGEWTYLLVGVLAFLETGAFVGLVAPGETTVIVGGVIAGQGVIDPVTLFGLTWACAVAGDVTSFLLGRRLGRDFLVRHGPRMQITEERLEQVERFFDRHGGVTILIGRFIGLIRALAPFVAGSTGLPMRRFLPYDVIGAGLWSGLFVGLGYVFWRSFDQVTEYAGRGAIALGALVALIAGVVFLHRLDRDPRMRARTRERLVRFGSRPLVRPFVPLARRLYGPARFFAGRLTPGALGLELTTLVAISAASLFAFVALGLRVDGAAALPGDDLAFDVLDGIRAGWLDAAARVVTDLGSTPVTAVLLLATAIWATRRGRGAEALAIVAGYLAIRLAVPWTKGEFDRPRPEGPVDFATGRSYPSGHAANAAALLACAVVLARAGWALSLRISAVGLALGLVAAVALTRVYLRVHHLSDVIGGVALGLAIFALCGVVALVVAFLRQNGSPSE